MWMRMLAAMVMVGIVGCERSRSVPANAPAARTNESKAAASAPSTMPTDAEAKVIKTDAEWKQILTPEQYHILREKGTDRAFAGALWDNHEKGAYVCAACDNELFSSDTKFESHTGWPSFWQPLHDNSVTVGKDNSLGMERDEVLCWRCGGHLGHVFDDGPKPTGLRYCMNSAAMKFVKSK